MKLDVSTVVQVLQVGFSGFAFLMAGLSFRLLREEQKRKGTGRVTILDAIQRYLRYTLVMAVLVAGASLVRPFVEGAVETQRQRSKMLTKEAADCRDGLSRLTSASMRIAKDYDSLVKAVQADTASCRPVLKALEEP